MNKSGYKKIFRHWLYEDCLSKKRAKVLARRTVRRYLKKKLRMIVNPTNHNGGQK